MEDKLGIVEKEREKRRKREGENEPPWICFGFALCELRVGLFNFHLDLRASARYLGRNKSLKGRCR